MTTIPLSDLSSSPSAKFRQIGDRYAGRLISAEQRQSTDLQGRPQTFSDGSPQTVWVFTIEQSGGDRVALWARGGSFRPASGTGDSMLNAISEAVRRAGADALDTGGELAVAHTGMGEASIGKNAPRLYTAEYRPPRPPSVPLGDLFSADR